MSMPVRSIACAALAALLATGCGGTEDPPDIPARLDAGEQLRMRATEYVFSPNRITIQGAEGSTRQRIALDNRGELAHNIELLDGDRIVGKLRSFPAGQERSLEVVLRPGRYTFVCTVADHDEKGMRGTLELRAKRR